MGERKSAAVEGLAQQAAKGERPARGKAVDEEAHADGEKGKPTARDATGRKMDGYARREPDDKDGDEADE